LYHTATATVAIVDRRPTVPDLTLARHMTGEVLSMSNRRFALVATLATLVLLVGCSGDDADEAQPGENSLDRLPADTGGTHLALPHDPDDPDAAPFGCYVYLPGSWQESPVPYPLLLFLHGAGERGDSAENPATLALVLRNGPPRLIDEGAWSPPYPLIVVSPQCHDDWWHPAGLRELLEWIDARYPIDRSRIFLSGLSMGGYGTWGYLGSYGDLAEDRLPIAAAAPICGAGNTAQADAIAQVPVWAFHGTDDGTVPPSGSVDLVKAVGAVAVANPPRLTLYEDVGHDSWSRTYDLRGLNEGLTTYPPDPAVEPWLVTYAPDLYHWLFAHRANAAD
jgi:predicted peptidase